MNQTTIRRLARAAAALAAPLAVCAGLSSPSQAAEVGEEVELYSAIITGASCARKALETGNLDAISACSPAQAAKFGFVLFDPAERAIFQVKPGTIYLYELEKGFGGSVDLAGTVTEEKDGLAVVEPEEYTITPRPKPGAFKGCL